MALDRLTKVDGGGISTTSDYRVGIVTASKFVGPFDGTGGNFSGIITATGANFSGNVTIGGTLTYEDVTNIDAVGLVTARDGIFLPDGKIAKFGNTAADPDLEIYHGGTNSIIKNSTGRLYLGANDITVSNRLLNETKATFNNNASVDLYYNGTKKFETSEKGIQVGTGVTLETSGQATFSGITTFSDAVNIVQGKKINFGNINGTNGHIYYDGSTTRFQTNAGLNIGAPVVSMKGAGLVGVMGEFIQNGAVKLWYNSGTYSTAKLETTATGVTIDGTAVAGGLDISGDIDVDGHTNLDNVSVAGVATFSSATGLNTGVKIQQTALNYSAGLEINATNGGQAALQLKASKSGTNRATRIDYFNQDSTDPKWTLINDWPQDGSNDFSIRYSNSNKIAINCTPDNQVKLYHNGNVKLETKGYGIDITGGFITTGGSIVNDGGNIKFGTHSDLQIFHDNSNNINVIQCHNGRTLHIDKDNGSENMAKFIPDGAVELYHGMGGSTGSSKKLQTTTTGAQIDTILKLNGDAGNPGKLQLQEGGALSEIRVERSTDTSSALLFGTEISGTTATRWKIDTAGHFIPSAVGTYNLGSTGAEIGNVFLADSKKVFLGSDQDASIYHDGTHGYLANTTGNLFVTNTGTNYTYVDSNFFRVRNSSGSHMFDINTGGGHQGVGLYYSPGSQGTEKLRTSATGITVNGEVAATQDYPNQRPTLDLNFTAVKKLDPRITYQRTGVASFTNEFGKVVLIGDNAPRFDHNPTTRDCKGLLLEESRKNYLENGDFVSSYGSGNSWTYGVGTDVFSASSGSQLSTNPDGSSPAYHYAPSSTAGHHRFYRTFTLDAYDTSYVVSVFAKRVTEGSVSGLNRYLEIEISGNFANNGAPTGHGGSHGMSSVTFDLQGDGAIESQSTTTHGYVGSPKMEKFADDWWRLSYIFNPGTNDGSSTLTGHIWFGHPASLGNDAGNETGNGNPSFYLWGTMIEKGGFLTSYIPNHGAYQLTRGMENVTITDDEFTDFYNPIESTAVCEFDTSNWITYNNNKYERIFAFGNHNTETDTFEVFKQNSSNSEVRYRVRTSNSNVMGAANYSYGTNTTPKVAFALKLNDAAVTVDGGTPGGTGDTGIPMPTVTKLSLGNSGIENNGGIHTFTGYIRRFMYYPVKLPDSQVVTLTS